MTHEIVRNAADARWEAEGRPEAQHEKHPREVEPEFRKGSTQTWLADHGGGMSPPTSTGSIEEEQVQEPSNDWPAADGGGQADGIPSPSGNPADRDMSIKVATEVKV